MSFKSEKERLAWRQFVCAFVTGNPVLDYANNKNYQNIAVNFADEMLKLEKQRCDYEVNVPGVFERDLEGQPFKNGIKHKSKTCDIPIIKDGKEVCKIKEMKLFFDGEIDLEKSYVSFLETDFETLKIMIKETLEREIEYNQDDDDDDDDDDDIIIGVSDNPVVLDMKIKKFSFNDDIEKYHKEFNERHRASVSLEDFKTMVDKIESKDYEFINEKLLDCMPQPLTDFEKFLQEENDQEDPV